MFIAASRYAGALGLVKNQSPEIVNYALRKNTFNKYQLNRSGIKSMQELVRYKVGVDYNGLCSDEIYAFANDMQTSIMGICINHIIKVFKLSQNDVIDFRFFCLQHDLTYEMVNGMLDGNNGFNKLMEKEIPEFYNFIKKIRNLQCILPTYKSLNDFTDHKLDIWSPTKYDLPYVPKPIKNMKIHLKAVNW
jgi:hypothetical protein